MKRFHVHVSVENLNESMRFYTTLFDREPAIVKPDYAKWMLEDPRLNFAISRRGHAPGLNHLGIQVESDAALNEMHARLQSADVGMIEQSGAACCYAKSDKYWVTDPCGIAWESFHTLVGDIPVFGEHSKTKSGDGACCVPVQETEDRRREAGRCTLTPSGTARTGSTIRRR